MVRSLILKLALFEVNEEKLYQTFPFSENVITCISLLPFVVKRKKSLSHCLVCLFKVANKRIACVSKIFLLVDHVTVIIANKMEAGLHSMQMISKISSISPFFFLFTLF